MAKLRGHLPGELVFLGVQIESREVGLDLSRCVEAQVAVLVETALAESAGRGIESPTRRADAADEAREACGRWRSLDGDGARGKRCV